MNYQITEPTIVMNGENVGKWYVHFQKPNNLNCECYFASKSDAQRFVEKQRDGLGNSVSKWVREKATL